LAVQHLANERKVAMLNGVGTTGLIGKSCSPTSVLIYFRYLHAGQVHRRGAAVETLGKSFFFITLDSAFGTAIEAALTKLVTEAGGKVVGTVKHPVGRWISRL